jgi:hypothetical protein
VQVTTILHTYNILILRRLQCPRTQQPNRPSQGRISPRVFDSLKAYLTLRQKEVLFCRLSSKDNAESSAAAKNLMAQFLRLSQYQQTIFLLGTVAFTVPPWTGDSGVRIKCFKKSIATYVQSQKPYTLVLVGLEPMIKPSSTYIVRCWPWLPDATYISIPKLTIWVYFVGPGNSTYKAKTFHPSWIRTNDHVFP